MEPLTEVTWIKSNNGRITSIYANFEILIKTWYQTKFPYWTTKTDIKLKGEENY